MKKLFIALRLAALTMCLLALTAIAMADPYEARPHEWRDKHTFRKPVTFAGGVTGVTREIFFPMAGWAIDGGDDIDEATAPDIGDDDNIPSVTWDNSGETGAIQQTFRLPTHYSSGLTLYCLVSSDTDLGTTGGLDWQIWVNTDGGGFDAAAIAQTGASTGSGSSMDTSNEVLTLTLDATGEAALSAGAWITIDLFNATTHASGNLELKGVHGTYTATQ